MPSPTRARPRPRRALRSSAVLVGLVVASTVLVGCGGREARVSLAIASAQRQGEAVVLRTDECADRLAVTTRPDPRGSGLVQVSLWGRPRLGRCRPAATVRAVPADDPKLVDAATGQVVDIAG